LPTTFRGSKTALELDSSSEGIFISERSIEAEMDQAITHALTVLLLGVALACTLRAQPKLDLQSRMLIFRPHLVFKGFAVLIAFIIPLAISILALVRPPKDEIELGCAIGLGTFFGGAGIFTLWETMRYRLVACPEGIGCYSPWRGLSSSAGMK
jgi:hypothetical protein